MNKEEYEIFYKELITAEVVTLHEFEKREIFEGCMPIEIMAKRGEDTLRFGPLKPVGFTDPRTGKRPYAVVQLRQDDARASLYNLVGFQTNLKFGEQKRVFSMIPGLQNAEFVKYGVMHRNTYIHSSELLDNTYCLKKQPNLYFAGQMTGALASYIATPNQRFQPMNANFGILPELEEKIKDKKVKYAYLADRAINALKQIKIENEG